MTERERKVQEKMMRKIRDYKGYTYKNAQNMFTEKGRPDLTACVPTTVKAIEELFGENAQIGIFVGIEVKRDRDSYDASDAQEIVGRKIKAAKGLWFVLDDCDVLEALLMKLTKYNGGNNVKP